MPGRRVLFRKSIYARRYLIIRAQCSSSSVNHIVLLNVGEKRVVPGPARSSGQAAGTALPFSSILIDPSNKPTHNPLSSPRSVAWGQILHRREAGEASLLLFAGRPVQPALEDQPSPP